MKIPPWYSGVHGPHIHPKHCKNTANYPTDDAEMSVKPYEVICTIVSLVGLAVFSYGVFVIPSSQFLSLLGFVLMFGGGSLWHFFAFKEFPDEI